MGRDGFGNPSGGTNDPHAPREIARRQRWADGGLASSVVGWDRDRPIATDDDAEPVHGPWRMVGVVLAGAFAVLFVAAMITAVVGADSPASESADDIRADSPELRLAVTDGVRPSPEHLTTYRDALDDASESCDASRTELADVVRNVSQTASGFGGELSSLELLRELPAASSRVPNQDCAETALDILSSRFD